MPRSFWIAMLALAFLVPFAAAGELTVKLTATEADKVPYLVRLVAPGASCAAAGDVVGMVAVGHKVDKQARLSLFRLDAQGRPTGAPIVVKLPKPAGLATRDTYPLSLAFHPSLPLLYVWQEVEGLKGDPVPPDEPAWKDLDHLLIYAIDKEPELLVGLCRGQLFHTGTVAGSLGLDVANGRLYVPNLRFGKKNPPEGGAVGWFNLGGDGLPVDGDTVPEKVEPVVAAAKAATTRAARAAALRIAAAAGKPVGAFRHTPENTYGFGWHPSGAGFVPISRDVFIGCGPYGPVTWNGGDRRARAQVFLMPVNFTSYYTTRIVAHPTLPVIFATIAGYPWAHRVEHADGNITLAPQVVQLEGATLRTPPVVLT
ncbi:MAG TPA: hypothetical protein VKD72_08800, partial [Gemmataceae bacterium]|nr:hypothetical protein [Gemmataceae bacterium]